MKKIYTFFLLAAAIICLPWSVKAEELTVADGTNTNQYFPVYGYCGDYYQKTQMIYPASMLTEMNGATLTSMTFYLSTPASAAWTFSSVIGLAEVNESELSSSAWNAATVETVYTGTLDGTNSTMTITFSKDFEYEGGNLLFELTTPTKGSNYPSAYFYGITGYYSLYGYNSSSMANINRNSQNFLPKTTFTYEVSSETCHKPTNLTISTLEANSASFSWTKGGDETEWLYLCLEADATQNWNSATKVTSPSVTVEGLTGTTDYKFYLRALCGAGDTSKVVSTAFTTPCAAIASSQLPWAENFNSTTVGEIPSCWETIDANSSGQTSISAFAGDWSFDLSSNALRFNGKSSYTYGYVLLPPFEAPLNTLQISFSHQAEHATSSGKIELGYFKGGVFTLVNAYDQNKGSMKAEEAYPLNELPDDAERIAFRYKSNSTYEYANVIDDIMVELIPSCVAPKNVVASPTPDGAVITWEQGKEENEYEYACGVAGFDPAGYWQTVTTGRTITIDGKMAGETYDFYLRSNCGTDGNSQAIKVSFTPECGAPTNVATTALTAHEVTIEWEAAAGITEHQFVCVRQGAALDWTGITPLAGTSVTIDTLQAATTYDFYVRSYYSDGVQSTATKLTFTTNCGAVSIGWNEKFDATTMPNCWEAVNVTNAKWAIYSYTDESYSGYSMRFAGKSAYSATLQTPSFELTEKALLKFYWKNVNDLSLDLKISEDGGATKTAIPNTIGKQTSYAQQTIDLSAYTGNTVILYFTVTAPTGSTQRTAYIDEMTLEYKPAEVPTNLAAASTSDGAVITWENNEEGPWDLRYKESESSDWTEVNGLAQKTYTLTALSAEKSYNVQVRANCSANRQSAWTASVAFAPTCPTPSAIEFSNQTYNGATVTWTAGGGESAWNLRYKNADDADWTMINNLTTRTQNLVNLTTGKEYTVEVQASCNGEWTSATYTPAFVVPTFASEEITDVAATISWNDVEGAISYKYALVPKGDAVDWSSAAQTVNAYAEISDLQALTEYDFYVKTMYTSGDSEAALKQFATIAIAPNGLIMDEVKATSATFSWAKNGSAARQYQVAVAEGATAADWANATLTENDVLTATVSGLTPNTSYTFYVRAYYDAEKVSAAVGEPFETPCAAIASFPWEENFESVSVETIPACWDKSASTATPDWDDPSYIWTVYLHNAGGNNLLRLNNSMVNADGIAVINTPSFEIPASPTYDLTFEYTHTASCGEFAVLISVDGGAFGNFAEPKSYGKTSESTSTSDPGELTNAVISLADYAGRTVAFQFNATPDNNEGAIFIDNVKVIERENIGTAIGNTGTEMKAVKTIENGQLIIIREGLKYNAQGVVIK